MKFIPFLLLPASAFAHHGQDFFVTLDTRVPDIGHGSAFMSASWENQSGGDETVVEPGVLVGLGHGFAVGSTFQWSNETPGSWGYAAVTPIVEWAIAIPDSPVRLGISISYHFADGSHPVSHSDTSNHFHEPVDTSGPGSNPDAPTGGEGGHVHRHGHGHDHGGIHRHGEDHFMIRFITDWQLNRETRAVFNVIAAGTASDDIALGYAVGLRREIHPKAAVGIESTGDFDSGGQHQLIAGLYLMPRHDLSVRVGIGTGLGPDSSDISLHSGLTWRF